MSEEQAACVLRAVYSFACVLAGALGVGRYRLDPGPGGCQILLRLTGATGHSESALFAWVGPAYSLCSMSCCGKFL